MSSRPLETNSLVAIIGAGNMGSGIAQKYATHGFSVTLVDQNEECLNRGKSSIELVLKQGVSRGVFSEEDATAIKKRITFSKDLRDCENASLVIEAIFENLRLKQELFFNLEDICRKDAILATNTSSLKVLDLQIGLKYPSRVLGLHYFYHPAKNRLVELIGTDSTSQEALNYAANIQERINKVTIRSKDSSGFIVNRFFVPWLNEAMHIVHEKKANIATVEHSAKKFFNIGMGPFELMNITGLPITFHSCNTLNKSFGDFYAPCPLLEPKIENKSLFDLEGPVDEKQLEEIGMRMLSVVSAICTQMVYEERICALPDVDLGARVGLLWQKGPFELTNKYLRALPIYLKKTSQQRKLLTIPASLSEHLKEDQPLPFSNVLSERKGRIGVITLNKPDTMNALDYNLLHDLACTFQSLAHDDNIDGIVIAGHRRAFMAGADLSFFNENLKAGLTDEIVTFAKEASDVFFMIDRCEKPVIAAVSGLALGGGLELALACDFIITTKNSRLSFPETGIGIYPGLGGTQRTPRRVGIPLARYLVLTGANVSGSVAFFMGLVDEICDEEALLDRAMEILKAFSLPTDRSVKSLPNELGDLIKAFDSPLQKMDQLALDATDRAKTAVKQLSKKAPLALEVADALISKSDHISLAEGLALETSHLKRIFETHDAKVGLKAALTKEHITFSGT